MQSYRAHADADRIRNRIIELNGAQKMDEEIATILNDEGLRTAHGPAFSGNMVHVLRKRWGITTVKINGTAANPQRWSDGSYSVQGTAEILGITSQTIFDWLRKGWALGPAARQGYAVANFFIARASRRAQNSSTTHKPFTGRGVMKSSSRQKRSAIRRTRDLW